MKLCLKCSRHFSDELDLCPHEGAQLVHVGQDPLIGAVINDRYKIESLVAKGAVGSVYRARHQFIERNVAIKVLHGYLGADPESLLRFHREAKALSRLDHPNLITLHDFGLIDDGQPFFVMEFLEGTTLSSLLQEKDHLPVEQALEIFAQVCSALQQAHDRQIVHRDLKPANIVLVEKDGNPNFVKLVDFSIAKLPETGSQVEPQLTVEGTICGSPAYMSPEQCRGADLDHRSDIYSLGVVLFETLSGRRPFSAKDLVSLMYLHVTDDPPSINEVRADLQFSSEIDTFIARVLSKDPADRPQTVQEFEKEMREAGGKPVTKPRVSIPSVANADGLFSSDSPANGQDDAPELPAGAEGLFESAIELVGPSAAAEKEESLPPATGKTEEAVEAAATVTRSGMAQLHSAEPAISAVQSRQRISDPRVTPQPVPNQGTKSGAKPHRDQNARRNTIDIPMVYTANAASGMLSTILILTAAAIFSVTSAVVFWPRSQTAEMLVIQEKFDEARDLLERRQREGRLSAQEQSTLNSVYIALAKRYAHQKKYNDAIAILQKIPTNSAQMEMADILMRNYKRILTTGTN